MNCQFSEMCARPWKCPTVNVHEPIAHKYLDPKDIWMPRKSFSPSSFLSAFFSGRLSFPAFSHLKLFLDWSSKNQLSSGRTSLLKLMLIQHNDGYWVHRSDYRQGLMDRFFLYTQSILKRKIAHCWACVHVSDIWYKYEIEVGQYCPDFDQLKWHQSMHIHQSSRPIAELTTTRNLMSPKVFNVEVNFVVYLSLLCLG